MGEILQDSRLTNVITINTSFVSAIFECTALQEMAYDILYVRIDHLQIQLQILCISCGLFLPFAAQPNLPYHNPTLQTICFDTKAKHATS